MIYISDRDPARVWRYSSRGRNLGIFWRPPAGVEAAPTGLAYDSPRNAILISDSVQDALYRVPASASELATAIDLTETLFNDGARQGYGFDGIDVTPAGDIYLALLAWNRAARLEQGELVMLARDFRGASDLVYDAARERLIVAPTGISSAWASARARSCPSPLMSSNSPQHPNRPPRRLTLDRRRCRGDSCESPTNITERNRASQGSPLQGMSDTAYLMK